MNTRLARRTAANVRAALAIVAFTVLAAIGFATTKSVRPIASPAADVTRLQSLPTNAAHVPVHTAPAACPMPAGAFRTH
jgi:hypothetical protein